MNLVGKTYGKGRVRVMRLSGEGDHRDVRELDVRAMLTGDIGRAFTDADNSTTVSTDTIKNVVNIVAREELELGPEAFETVVGRAEIREVFSAGKHGRAAGLLVTEGVIRKALKARITRNDVIIYNGQIASLRRFKDDVAQVIAGLECGVLLADTHDIKAGDNLEVFEVEERARTL